MKIAFTFPGFGSQFVGMGKDLYDELRLVQEYFEEAGNCLDTNFVKLCFASSDAQLSQPYNAYLSLFVLQCAIAAVLKERGIKPDLVIGYGIGQASAVYAADGISFPDGLYALKKYAQFYEESMDQFSDCVFRVTGLGHTALQEQVDAVPDNSVTIAACRSEREHVISGPGEQMILVGDAIKELPEATIEKIDPAYGLYSALMEPVVKQLTLYLGKVDFKELSCPFVSTIDGSRVTDNEAVKKAVVGQIFTPVRWDKAVEQLRDYDIVIQIGPGKNMQESIMEACPNVEYFIVATPKDLAHVEEKMNMIPDRQKEA